MVFKGEYLVLDAALAVPKMPDFVTVEEVGKIGLRSILAATILNAEREEEIYGEDARDKLLALAAGCENWFAFWNGRLKNLTLKNGTRSLQPVLCLWKKNFPIALIWGWTTMTARLKVSFGNRFDNLG